MKMNASEKAGLAACGVTIISLAIASYKLQKERDKALKQRDHYKEMYEMASTQDSRKSRTEWRTGSGTEGSPKR